MLFDKRWRCVTKFLNKSLFQFVISRNRLDLTKEDDDNMDSPFVYLKIYTITDGPESFIILSE
ncbi:hypothetical protein T01_15729 [Trichinella spiralis]|uniref:Uncharacterized protein n=1 Tax=Trichinella spiralis TaxID=6334 RepID=A0A0V1BCV7_TRISP|nr:hypothetical protein T01_15729 [Trichinella spiralis]